ncbi:hypothetical protein GWK47_037472 [Chionoecetes opilio]|uniref:Uncharacterized protein n=1 Tax=Chionoecetes opilio TaxID=41210 RepID=A0A8J5CYP2_CHIOP|nr:hypothetical protein GWK47_037472 [Chionoecetes opilio]
MPHTATRTLQPFISGRWSKHGGRHYNAPVALDTRPWAVFAYARPVPGVGSGQQEVIPDVSRRGTKRPLLCFRTLAMAFLYRVVALFMRSRTSNSPSPQGTTTRTLPKHTVTFISPVLTTTPPQGTTTATLQELVARARPVPHNAKVWLRRATGNLPPESAMFRDSRSLGYPHLNHLPLVTSFNHCHSLHSSVPPHVSYQLSQYTLHSPHVE